VQLNFERLERLIALFPNARTLILQHARGLTTDALAFILRQCPELHALGLCDVHALPVESAHATAVALRQLTKIHLGGTCFLESATIAAFVASPALVVSSRRVVVLVFLFVFVIETFVLKSARSPLPQLS
jgi:hypothetical protein